jgi:GT2 family glycosyltransferase
VAEVRVSSLVAKPFQTPSEGREAKVPIDVIIVNYNSTKILSRCLDSIFTYLRPNVKVLVEDNNSSDQVEEVKVRYPQIKLTVHSRNLGFAAAVNHGLAKSTAPYVLILNPDAALQDNNIYSMLEYMDQHGQVGLIGPMIRNPDGTIQGSARAFHGLHTAFAGRKSLLSKWFPNNPLTRKNIRTWQADQGQPFDVDWVSGACMLVRRDTIEQVGAMDERFFLYFEDTDWCRRIWSAGWRVVYFPGTTIEHQVGASTSQTGLLPLWEFHRSCYRYLGKYFFCRHPILKGPVGLLILLRFSFVAILRLVRNLCGLLPRQRF